MIFGENFVSIPFLVNFGVNFTVSNFLISTVLQITLHWRKIREIPFVRFIWRQIFRVLSISIVFHAVSWPFRNNKEDHKKIPQSRTTFLRRFEPPRTNPCVSFYRYLLSSRPTHWRTFWITPDQLAAKSHRTQVMFVLKNSFSAPDTL